MLGMTYSGLFFGGALMGLTGLFFLFFLGLASAGVYLAAVIVLN